MFSKIMERDDEKIKENHQTNLAQASRFKRMAGFACFLASFPDGDQRNPSKYKYRLGQSSTAPNYLRLPAPDWFRKLFVGTFGTDYDN